MKRFVYHLFFPKRCLCCGKTIPYRLDYCEACEGKMPSISGERCLLCGCAKSECDCKGQRFHFQSIAAPFYYEGGAKHALLKLKSYPVYAAPLAAECVKVFEEVYADENFDIITFVPMHESRLKQTGFHHSKALAQEIAKRLSLPCEPTLKVLYEAQAQHTLPLHFRGGNVKGLYDIMNQHLIAGKCVLLVDDIKTSGATLHECALILQLYGAKRVCALTAAVRRKEHHGFRN